MKADWCLIFMKKYLAGSTVIVEQVWSLLFNSTILKYRNSDVLYFISNLFWQDLSEQALKRPKTKADVQDMLEELKQEVY